jgi:hypothetical protein
MPANARLRCSCIVEEDMLCTERGSERGARTSRVVFVRVTGEMLQSTLDRKPYILLYWKFSEMTPELSPWICSIDDGSSAIARKKLSPVFILCSAKKAIFKLSSVTSVSGVCAPKTKDCFSHDGLLCCRKFVECRREKFPRHGVIRVWRPSFIQCFVST